MISITQLKSWKALEQQAQAFLSRQNLARYARAPVLSNSHMTLDCSAQRIDSHTHALLLQLAEECQLQQKIEGLFLGHHVNTTEDRPALHSALRVSSETEVCVNHINIIPQIQTTLNHMRDIATQIRAHAWLGYSGKPVTDIVNIGIGGSHLGPFFCLHALTDLALPSLQYHFISDFDSDSFSRVTAKLNPETTLFIVSSKSFTTAETLYNLKKAMAWFNKPDALSQHFIAVTACPEKASALGISHILPIWDWVGGRYSACSAINLITCIAVGFDAFAELLKGAASMDDHFRHAPFNQNLPVNLALFGIWTNNFLNIHQLLLLTYAQNLDYFTPYIQQLEMESNGKSIDQYGRVVDYVTAPIVWGGSGNQAQHSYYQLLCQGTHDIAADFISVDAHHPSEIHHLCMAQKEVLSGSACEGEYLHHKAAINHIRLKDVSPMTIGALIALYEHKVYVQSVIWQINAFDQPGVESSKRLMRRGLADA